MFDFGGFDIVKALSIIAALVVAIVGQIMHGYVAYRYGDTTAKHEGRLSINPIIHVDPIGTIVVPLMLFISGSPFCLDGQSLFRSICGRLLEMAVTTALSPFQWLVSLTIFVWR